MELMKRFGPLGAAIAFPVIAFVVNETEEYRIAFAIKNGKFRPDSPTWCNSEFCQFPRDKVKTFVFNDSLGLCALIGPSISGKSTQLQKFGSDIENKNVLFCELHGHQNTDLDDIMHETMIQRVFNMPGFLYHVALPRQSRRSINERIFRKVYADTQEPVTLLLDISSNVSVGRTTEEANSLSPTQLVKEIKHYVAGARVVRCLFAAPEGLFEDEARREPRLSLFIASGELSVESAKLYLQHLVNSGHEGTADCDDNQLKMFPRHYINLMKYSAAVDKDKFVQGAMATEKLIIKKSFNCMNGKMCRLFTFVDPVKKLYQTALNRDIDLSDVHTICGLSKKKFINHFVKTNIFQQTDIGTYKLHCDATRNAVAAVLAGK